MALLVDAAIGVALLGIIWIIGKAFRQDDGAAAVNAVLSLVAALLPLSLGVSLDLWWGMAVRIPAPLTLWIAVAGLLHSIGMLGPYETVWWYDHLTHLVSVALVTALLYAGLLALDQQPGGFEAGRLTIAALAVALAMLAGVCWELLELGAHGLGERIDVEPVLVHYGWRDTAMDLLFDFLGALVVVLLDLRTFVGLAEESIRVTRLLVVPSSRLVLIGSVATAALVWATHRS